MSKALVLKLRYLVRAQAGFKLCQTQRLSEVDGSSAPCLLPECRSAVIWCVRVVAVKIYDVTCITSAVVPARQPSTTSMFSAPEQRYQRNLAEKAVIGRPTEDILYAVFNEFAILHQQRHRFVIYPQMNLKWKPQNTRDRRSEVPDFGLGNFTLPNSSPNFKLRCGIEAKRAIDIMTSLPPCQLNNAHPRCQISISYPLFPG